MADILRLKKSNCKNCFKCIRDCSVKAIRYWGDQAHINNSECILCGKCFVSCPQDAQVIVDTTETVSMLLQSGETVIASVDPSFVAYYGGAGIGALRAALLKLGFSDVQEMAIGAAYVKREYEKILASGTQDVMITSCCHSVNLLISKYFPKLAHCLIPVVSPMTAHCMDIKARNPRAKTVYIGPCLAKKDEAEKDAVDAVMTFSELDAMLAFAGIVVEKKREVTPESRTRLFPTVGTISH